MEELQQRKARKDTEMLPDHDRDKTPLADKIANQIIDSVRHVSTTPPKSPKSPTKTPTVVRRSSSGTSNSSVNSDRGSRYSLGNLLKRSSYVQSSPQSSPVQSRIQKKIGRQSSMVTQETIVNPKKSESSAAKKAAFTRERSKTGLNLFGGRRRSIAITDEDYESIRAAKSYHDLRNAANLEVVETSSKIIEEQPGKQRKNFSERPWTELEKLWRGRVKAPGPDLEEILASSRQHGNSLTLPNHYKSRPTGLLTAEHSHAKGYWPPPSSPTKPSSPKTPVTPTRSSPNQQKRKASNSKIVKERSQTTAFTPVEIAAKKTVLPIEVTRKAVNLMSPTVFNSWMPGKQADDHFKDLLHVW